MKVLGIETSCDETGVAIYDAAQGLLSHALYSQIEIHEKFGGVVPELASRDHIKKIIPLITEVLETANLKISNIDGIAYTAGPGLAGALLVGATFARSLAWSLEVPAVQVHHMEGHLLAPMLEENPPQYPFVALLVSGGHTQLVNVRGFGVYELLGESIDDAVGEAFDKTAKLLGLGYPGGAALSKLAEKGNPNRFIFPRPMVDRPGLEFSFSGLKTFALNTVLQNRDKLTNKLDEQTTADIAIAFQAAAIDTLIIKCRRALKLVGSKRLVVAGGVGANKMLRQQLKELSIKENLEVFFPRIEFCTDNGAMIAYVGCQRLLRGMLTSLNISVFPRWKMGEEA